jgi:protoporphyrinogen/coproporphyrinogen III oxidase
MKKVRILGAGISGLLCAYYAVKKGYAVEVYECDAEPGGKIRTIKGSHGLMETAANATLADLEVERVAEEIGLQLVRKKKTAQRRYIYVNSKITRWPLDLWHSFRLLVFFIFWKLGRGSVEPQKSESLASWSDRVLGTKTTISLLSPACLGIFGVDAKTLSGPLIYQYFFSRKKKVYGKLRGSVAPQEGMGQWIDSLRAYLQQKGVVFFFNFSSPKEEWARESLIVATDVQSAAGILKFYKDPRAEKLQSIPLVNLLSVNAFYKKRPVSQKAGFGVLFSRSENIIPLGVLFNTDIFAGRSTESHSETWIFGSDQNLFLDQSDEYFLSEIHKTRAKLWQDETSPSEVRFNRWPGAIPLYGLALEKVLEELSISSGGLHLMGNYLGEIGLNRLFHRAKNLVEQI